MIPCSYDRNPAKSWLRGFKAAQVCFAFCLLLLCPGLARAQGWQSNTAPISAAMSLLLTDGTVISQDFLTGDWWKLTPDNFGSYVNGTWSQIASLPAGYGPLYYASAVLADGRVVILGGEYNFGSPSDTNMAAIYDPVADTWTTLAGPPGWASIGDASCTVLPDGTFLLANQFGSNAALLDPATLTWTTRSFKGKSDPNAEEGWTLLQNGNLLTIDCQNGTLSEIYNPLTDTWTGAGSTINALSAGLSGIVNEMGPQVLRPDGTVVAFGASGHNSVYHTATNSWTAAPDFPNGLDVADGPACLLPNGNVFVGASPGVFNPGTKFFEFDGTNLNPAPDILFDGPNIPTYVMNMVMLPTGQVYVTKNSTDTEIYTPTGGPLDSWRPTITDCPTSVQPGSSYTLSGTQLNGLSQNGAYGDDSSNATNYPLVRITSQASGHVTYFRTHDHSTMGIATGSAIVSTNFDVPLGVELGPADLVVVTNGIESAPFPITVGQSKYKITDIYVVPNSVVGGQSVTGTVTLGDYAPIGGITVNITSGKPSVANVPRTVVIVGGSTTADFTINTGTVATDTTVAITASYFGTAQSTTMTVLTPTALSLTVAPSSVRGGQGSTGTITLNGPAPVGGKTVVLSSSNPSVVKLPASVTIAAGALSAPIAITTSTVSANTTVTLSATLGGIVTGTLTVLPPDLTGLTFAPSSVKGGTNSVGTITLSAVAPAGGTVVNLTKNNAAVSVPASVSVPGGAKSATFTVSTTPVSADTGVTITAIYGATTTTGTITVQAPVLTSLALNPTNVHSLVPSSGVLTLDAPAPTGGMVVTLTSPKPSVASVPATVTVPAGATTVTYPITTGSVTAYTSVVLSAKLGTVTKTAELVIVPSLPFDFDGDGHNDLMFQISSSGLMATWFMNGLNVLGGSTLNLILPAGWQVVGVADFNADAHPDILIQNQTTGNLMIWYLLGTNVQAGSVTSINPGADYKVVGIGDFNHDNKPDILFQSQSTGSLVVWFMDGSTVIGSANIATQPFPNYLVVGVGDFNGDGQPDIVMQNSVTNQIVVWYMNGVAFNGGGFTSTTPALGYQVKGIADYNNDGQTDIVFQNSTTQQVVMWFMNGLTVIGSNPISTQPPTNYRIVGPR